VIGVDTTAFRERFGLDVASAFPHLPGLVADGLVETTNGRVRLTERGRRFADAVAATFV
jgi:coproporphyrinogen III oxidase-like Fe-S oxidoreductase